MKFILTVEVETHDADEIFGVKEQIAAALEEIGKVSIPQIRTDFEQLKVGG